MTTIQSASHGHTETNMDSKKRLPLPLTVGVSVAILLVFGAAFWLWQSDIGATLSNLPIVDTMLDPMSEAETTADPPINGQRGVGAGNTINAENAPFARGQRPGGVQAQASDGQTGAPAQAQAVTESTAQNSAIPAAVTALESEGDQTVEQLASSNAIVAIVGISDILLWDDPGVSVQTSLSSGTPLQATHRSEDSRWLYVKGNDITGWIEAAGAIAIGVDKLLVLPMAQVDAPENPKSAEPVTQADSQETSLLVNAGDLAVESANVETRDIETGDVETVDMMGTVTLADSRLNVRSGPGTTHTIIAKAHPGEEYRVTARDASGEWAQIVLPDTAATNGTSAFGWVSLEYLALSDALDALPVSLDISDAPAFDETAGDDSSQAAATAISPVAASQTPIDENTGTVDTVPTGLSGTLAFQTSHGMIYLYELDTGESRPLTTGFDPAISPDGTMVAFTRDGGEHGLYVSNIDGSAERLLYSGGERIAAPKWSVDGGELLFSYRTETLENGGGALRGGTKSILVANYDYHLAVVDINGDNYHDVSALYSAQAADWNEAGIVYQSDAGIQLTQDAPGAENRLVTFDYLNPHYHDPDWQPGGGQIAFMQREASHWEIYIVNPDGSGMSALTRPVTALVDELPSNVAPAYSPDGQHIVYLSNRGEDNSAGAWQLWVTEADGSNARPLPVDVDIEYTFGDEQAVSWGIA